MEAGLEMGLPHRIKAELSKPFYNGWTLKDFIAIGSILAILVADHVYVKALREDVGQTRKGIEEIKGVIAIKSEEGARVHQELRDGIAHANDEINRLRAMNERGR